MLSSKWQEGVGSIKPFSHGGLQEWGKILLGHGGWEAGLMVSSLGRMVREPTTCGCSTLKR